MELGKNILEGMKKMADERRKVINNLAEKAQRALNDATLKIESEGNSKISRYIVIEIVNNLVYGTETFLLAKKIHELITGNKKVNSGNLSVSVKECAHKIEITLDRTKT